MKFKNRTMPEICHDLAEMLIVKWNFKTIAGKKNDEIYAYMAGYYKDCGKEVIKIETEKILGELSKTHYVNEVINKIARKTYTERELMGCKDINLICLDNGVLDLKKMELLSHSPEYRFMNKLPLSYKPKARCPEILEMIEEILYEKDIKAIQEWFGYLLLRDYKFKKAIIFRGPRDSGKTTMINLFMKFIHERNISGIDLKKLSEGRWFTKSLYEKYANIVDELSEKDIEDVETFKAATGRSPLRGEYKFGDDFYFKNYAKLMFACNKVPYIKTNKRDSAYYNRWMIFDFDNVFDEKDKKTNTKILDEVCTEKEMSGLLNWAIEGLNNLLKNGYFSYSRTWEDNKMIMESESSSIAAFNYNCCSKGDEIDWISKEMMHIHYKEYCELNDLGAETKEKFGKNFLRYCSYGIDSKKGNVLGWRNVKVKEVKPVMGF